MAVMEGDRGLKLLGRKLGRNWLPVLVVSMLAIVAVSELHTPYMPAVLWLCAIIAILAVRERPVGPKTDETAVAETDEPEAPAESVISGPSIHPVDDGTVVHLHHIAEEGNRCILADMGDIKRDDDRFAFSLTE